MQRHSQKTNLGRGFATGSGHRVRVQFLKVKVFCISHFLGGGVFEPVALPRPKYARASVEILDAPAALSCPASSYLQPELTAFVEAKHLRPIPN